MSVQQRLHIQIMTRYVADDTMMIDAAIRPSVIIMLGPLVLLFRNTKFLRYIPSVLVVVVVVVVIIIRT